MGEGTARANGSGRANAFPRSRSHGSAPSPARAPPEGTRHQSHRPLPLLGDFGLFRTIFTKPGGCPGQVLAHGPGPAAPPGRRAARGRTHAAGEDVLALRVAVGGAQPVVLGEGRRAALGRGGRAGPAAAARRHRRRFRPRPPRRKRLPRLNLRGGASAAGGPWIGQRLFPPRPRRQRQPMGAAAGRRRVVTMETGARPYHCGGGRRSAGGSGRPVPAAPRLRDSGTRTPIPCPLTARGVLPYRPEHARLSPFPLQKHRRMSPVP